MQWPDTIDWTQVGTFLLIFFGIGIVISLLLAIWVVRSIRRLNIPPNADTFDTLRMTPLAVVIVLDLLDFFMDFLSAPVAWVILGYLGLQKLRGVTVVESLIPGTQVIPTMTAAWIIARLIRPDQKDRLKKYIE